MLGLLYYVFSHKPKDVEISQRFANSIHNYEILGEFGEDYAAVKNGGKWGFINNKGEEVIPCILNADYVGCFSEGKACLFKDSVFFFIDKQGNTLFQVSSGNNHDIDEEIYKNIMRRLPQFHNGICKTPYMEMYDASSCKILHIDANGKIKKEEKVSYNEMLSLFSPPQSDYTQFVENGLIGLKDSKGNIVIPAKYALVSTTLSNGVFLAVINEEGDGRMYCPRKTKTENTFYGYVDLLGNETFSKTEYDIVSSAIQERERVARGKAEEQIREKQRYERDIKEQKQREIAVSNNWLYGTWRYDIEGGAYLKLTINASQITETFFMPSRGEMTNVRSYYIDGNRLYTDKTKYKLDRTNKRLLGDDGSLFKRVSNSTTTSAYRNTNTYGNTNANSSVNSETNNRIARLERKAQDDINELNAMVSSGRMHPVTLMYIKQNLPDELSELMNYYRNQGNSSKYEEYAYKRRVVVQVLREIGI